MLKLLLLNVNLVERSVVNFHVDDHVIVKHVFINWGGEPAHREGTCTCKHEGSYMCQVMVRHV